MRSGKVLIYRNELLPLSETFILSQAGALRRFEPVFAGLMRVNNGLDLARETVLTFCGEESLAEKAKRRLFLRTGSGRLFSRAIAEQEPQIIHAHFAVDACAVLPIARRLRIPLIVTLHGYDVSCHEAALERWPTNKAYFRRKEELWRYVDTFLCVSEHVRQRALFRGFPAHKLRVHHLGIQLSRDSTLERDRDKTIVLFAGRLVEKKGCIYLIRAMARVLEDIPEAQLVISGDGPQRAMLEREAASCCRNAIFLGHQPHAAVRQWMRRARVLVAPSVRARNGDSEGLPTVLCEAQAEGLPVVAFDTEGVIEALFPERRSSLAKAEDVAALAKEIVHFLKDDKAWRRASDAGMRHVKAHFDLAAQSQLLEEKYDEVLVRSRA
ncbi:glycosyltransferase [Alloacidobacterium sp.]|uniref:glycosyltransferase n=1 Tax=Alloacidobacterium sp. TaxID=2951999 RepID=UPI002D647258|nr:glycosyltransferase [Alloacidobacterium sp.]HYK35331.1 glycosyltransferase [Alloacidobacterium sp.]